MIGQIENMFGYKPSDYTSPLEKEDHPEVDTSDELNDEGVKKYQIPDNDWFPSMGSIALKV
jgi:hypothetical protein